MTQSPLDAMTAFTAPVLKMVEATTEAFRLSSGKPTSFATPNTVVLDLKTMHLRDYSTERSGALPIIVHAPFAGHDSVIADFHERQSLMGCLKQHAAGPLYLTDWKSANAETKDFGIDEYLAELLVAVDHVGGRAHLIGLCQGGWAVAMFAARFPDKVASLVLAGAPLDLSAGDGPIKKAVQGLSPEFYRQLVAFGGGCMRGAFMLQGFKNMHPFEQYVEKYIHLYEHAAEPDFRERIERFAGWFEHPIDLPGKWYLQVVQELFNDNLFYNGDFQGLGRRLSISDIHCPTYLLAGKDDDITPPVQVRNAAKRLGTPQDAIKSQTVPGGHVGLFMSHKTVGTVWPEIAEWIRQNDPKPTASS